MIHKIISNTKSQKSMYIVYYRYNSSGIARVYISPYFVL